MRSTGALGALASCVALVGMGIWTGCGDTTDEGVDLTGAEHDSGSAGGTAGADAGAEDRDATSADGDVEAESDARRCFEVLPDEPVTDAEKACDRLAGTACDAMNRCTPGEWNRVAWGLPHTDPETCRARLSVLCVEQLALPGSPPPSALESCADRMPTFACDAVFIAERFGDMDNVRQLTHDVALDLCGTRGTRADGEPCDGAVQCASAHCEWNDADGCGKCVRLPAAGEACNLYCETGLYCRTLWDCNDGSCTSQGSICEPLSQEGGPCTTSGNSQWSVGCGFGLHCVDEVCRAVAPMGATCSAGNSEPPFCNFFEGAACSNAGRCEIDKPFFGESCYPPDDEECVPNPMTGRCYCLYPALGSGNPPRCELPRARCTL
jgi:hypothetical protein